MEGWAGGGQAAGVLHLEGLLLEYASGEATNPSSSLTLRSGGKQEFPASQKSPGLPWNAGRGNCKLGSEMLLPLHRGLRVGIVPVLPERWPRARPQLGR